MFASRRNQRFSIGGRDVSIGVFPLSHIDDQFIADWVALEDSASEGNACLSPHFVLPAHRYLDPRMRPLLLAIFFHDGAHRRLIGLGVFIARPPSLRFPLPHLDAYQSCYTFLTGMLLDRDHQWLALQGLGAYLSSAKVQWCGIEFTDRLADGTLDQIHRDRTVNSIIHWSEYYRNGRAILRPKTAAETRSTVLADGRFGRELRRKRRRLEEKGEVGWRFRAGSEVTPDCVETLLRLEDRGWKAEIRRSMLARAGHAEFFREMSRRFADRGRAFFTELTLDGRVIASTSNFISGRIGFAFKIGWDPEFAAVSPGLLNELELMRHADKYLAAVDFVDSGASEGSFIDRLWRDRREVATGILTGGYAGAAILPALSMARRLKRGMA